MEGKRLLSGFFSRRERPPPFTPCSMVRRSKSLGIAESLSDLSAPPWRAKPGFTTFANTLLHLGHSGLADKLARA